MWPAIMGPIYNIFVLRIWGKSRAKFVAKKDKKIFLKWSQRGVRVLPEIQKGEQQKQGPFPLKNLKF